LAARLNFQDASCDTPVWPGAFRLWTIIEGMNELHVFLTCVAGSDRLGYSARTGSIVAVGAAKVSEIHRVTG
jgi:hypothetical protein